MIRKLWPFAGLADVLGFVVILGMAIGGVAGIPFWIVLPASLALMLTGSLKDTFLLKPRFEAIERVGVFWLAVATHWAHAFVACCAGFVLGLIIRWLWW